mgnify:CR=1 FL=1
MTLLHQPVSSLNDTERQMEAVALASEIANWLSIVGCIFNIATSLFLKTSSNVHIRQMVIVLGAVDILFSGGSLLMCYKMTSEFLCQFEAFITNFGFASSLALTCCFAHTLNNFLRQQIIGERLHQDIKKYYIITGIFGFVIAALTVILGFYEIDPETSFCWHSVELDVFDWKDLILCTVPIVAATGYCISSYLSVIQQLRSYGFRAYLELLFYPIVLVICFFPGITLSFYLYISGSEHGPFVWWLLANVLLSCQGLFNAFVYGLSRKIIVALQTACCKVKRNSGESVYSREEEVLIHRYTEGSLLHPSFGSEIKRLTP